MTMLVMKTSIFVICGTKQSKTIQKNVPTEKPRNMGIKREVCVMRTHFYFLFSILIFIRFCFYIVCLMPFGHICINWPIFSAPIHPHALFIYLACNCILGLEPISVYLFDANIESKNLWIIVQRTRSRSRIWIFQFNTQCPSKVDLHFEFSFFSCSMFTAHKFQAIACQTTWNELKLSEEHQNYKYVSTCSVFVHFWRKKYVKHILCKRE